MEDRPTLMDGYKRFDYFPYVFFKRTITKDASLLLPAMVVRWRRSRWLCRSPVSGLKKKSLYPRFFRDPAGLVQQLAPHLPSYVATAVGSFALGSESNIWPRTPRA